MSIYPTPCLKDLARQPKPDSEQKSNEMIVAALTRHRLQQKKKTGRASLTYNCMLYLYQLPSTETEARKYEDELVEALTFIGMAYNNFNINDATQERDMGLFRGLLHKRYGESYALELIKKSKISNSERTIKHMRESRAIRNERHDKPLVLTVSRVDALIASLKKDIWPNNKVGLEPPFKTPDSLNTVTQPIVSDAIPLLFELCTGARTGEVTSFAEFSVVTQRSTLDTPVTQRSTLDTPVTFIQQIGCLKQKEKSDSLTICKPLLLNVDGDALVYALSMWREANQYTSAIGHRLNVLLQTRYLSEFHETYRVSTHLLRTIYANMAYETIVKPNLWGFGVCTLNKFLNDSLGHHSLEMGLAYLHVVIVDDTAKHLRQTLEHLTNNLIRTLIVATGGT